MAEKSRERWGQRLQEKGFSPREGGGQDGEGKKGVKAGLRVGWRAWARELCENQAHTGSGAGGPVRGEKQTVYTCQAPIPVWTR